MYRFDLIPVCPTFQLSKKKSCNSNKFCFVNTRGNTPFYRSKQKNIRLFQYPIQQPTMFQTSNKYISCCQHPHVPLTQKGSVMFLVSCMCVGVHICAHQRKQSPSSSLGPQGQKEQQRLTERHVAPGRNLTQPTQQKPLEWMGPLPGGGLPPCSDSTRVMLTETGNDGATSRNHKVSSLH